MRDYESRYPKRCKTGAFKAKNRHPFGCLFFCIRVKRGKLYKNPPCVGVIGQGGFLIYLTEPLK